MPKKQDQLTELLNQYKDNDMTASEMAQFLRGLLKLQPEVLNPTQEEPNKKGRRKNVISEPGREDAQSSTSTL